MVTAYVMMAIIYRQSAKDKALRLFDIAVKNNKYLTDKTPEQAREIGELLGYTERSIEEYIRRKYPNKIPIAPEPEDYNNMDENSQNDKNSQKENFTAVDKEIEKDNLTHGLDKKLVRVYNDGVDINPVYAVNGDEVRESGFIEWVEGGNHWVDADLPEEEQKYAKHIPKDELWVDDVHLTKPNDFEGILLHERTESYLIKHYGYTYDDAHEIANKIELLFRKRAQSKNIQTDEDSERLSSSMFVAFKKHFKSKKGKKFQNEGVGDVAAEKQFGVTPQHRGFEDKFLRDQKEDVVYASPTSDLVIIKNPKSLSSIFGYARGVIDVAGNLYIEQRPTEIHFNILSVLNKLGLVEDEADWDTKLPTNFVTVQRYLRTDKIFLGESNFPMIPDNKRPADSQTWQKMPSYKEAQPIYQRFLDRAKQKTPIFEFINVVLNTSNINENTVIFETKNMNEVEIMSIQNLPFKNEIEKLGGEIYAVGGAVRDEFLGKESKDLDIIIRNIPEEQLVKILAKYGTVNPVGKSFAVMKFRPKNSDEIIDIALPRTEVSTGEGHKDFEITADYRLPIEKDLERRDFTINAIAKDMQGNIIDPFDGQEDLTNKIIRVTHPKSFFDDPLRMLRAVQFASRFGFKIEPETYQMIKDNAGRIKSVAKDRVQEELSKIVEKGDPFTGAQLLQDSGLLSQMTGVNVPPFTNDEKWQNVRTLAEFVYMLVHNVQSPLDFYKRNLRGDTAVINELQGLMIGMDEKNISTNPIINRSIAHNMASVSKGNNVLQSKLLPPSLQVACQELLTGKYPITINDLAVNGNDLIKLDLSGKQLGDMQKSLLVKVYADKVKNDKNDLLAVASQGGGEVKEGVADTYAEKQFNIPNVPAKMNVQAMAGMQKDVASPVGYVIPFASQQRVPIFLNPKSLTNFDNDVRAIVSDKGDLYVAQESGRFNHGAMSVAIGLFDDDNDLYENEDKYQGLHRIGNTNGFGLSDSSLDYSTRDFENLENVKYILYEARKKNPQYKFYAQYYDNVDVNNDEPVDMYEYMEYPEVIEDKYLVNGEEVGIQFFVKKYNEWNNLGGENSGYSEPSKESVFEFLQNNYEDFIHNDHLKRDLLWALTDREVLNEKQ
jgi:tRNA nucleotidyltransferase (CCA-adding enzyme)